MLREFFFGGSEYRQPREPVPFVRPAGVDYATPPATGLRFTWLGHSTILLEIGGMRLLIDPVWSQRVSPFSFAGPKRFFPPPMPLAELPAIDAIVLSHDHFDHLDQQFVRAFAGRTPRWIVPLAVDGWLRQWGVDSNTITDLDWWESTRIGEVTLTATPARHFSGRGLRGRDRTLWCGWSFHSAAHRVYYSGDSAMQDEFAEIGARLGPFDLTMIDAGAYDALWADVHLGPEQAVLAHQLVRGEIMLPVHWALFDLALHGWTEPIERVLVAAQKAGARVIAPRPGELVEPTVPKAVARWWPALPWRTAEEAPVRSTGIQSI